MLLLLCLGQVLGNLFLRIFKSGHTGLGHFGLIAFPLFHQCPDRGCYAVKLGGFIIIVELELTAALIEGKHLIDGLFAIEPLHSQTADYLCGVSFNLLKSKHSSNIC